jgi:hypothetical protein
MKYGSDELNFIKENRQFVAEQKTGYIKSHNKMINLHGFSNQKDRLVPAIVYFISDMLLIVERNDDVDAREDDIAGSYLDHVFLD